MASELYNTIDALSREKGIDPQIVVTAVEDAIVMATRQVLQDAGKPARRTGQETGKINAYAVRTVVETPGAGGRPVAADHAGRCAQG